MAEIDKAAVKAELQRRNELAAIEAELLRRGVPARRSESFEAAEIRAELARRGVLPEPHPELRAILAEFGERHSATLAELDAQIEAAAEAERQLEEIRAAALDPGVLMARAVEALAQALDAMVRAAATPRRTIRTVQRDAEGNIQAVIDEAI